MHTSEIPSLVSQGLIDSSALPDPHWDPERCVTCHETVPDEGGLYLRHEAPQDEVCTHCHNGADHAWIHPVDIVPDSDFTNGISSRFRDAMDRDGERISCGTCHLIKAPCRMNRFYQKQYWPNFLRGWPYGSATEMCFECHEKTDYRPLVAHNQVTDDGGVIEDSCLLCHRQIPQQFDDGTTAFTSLVVERDLKSVCINCHANRPHPSGNVIFSGGKLPNHLAIPPADIGDHMQVTMDKDDIHMPLDPSDGSIYCATCHNPHEEGVIMNAAGAKGAGKKNFLRTDNICRNCHDQIQ